MVDINRKQGPAQCEDIPLHCAGPLPERAFDIFTEITGAQDIQGLPDHDYSAKLKKISAAMEEAPRTDESLHELVRIASDHEDWNVRRLAVETLADRFADSPAARKAICEATHDDVDWVAFTAIRAAGRLRLPEAVEHMIRISGWPSNFSQPGYTRKPVGCGAAFTKQALWQFFGTKDPAKLRELEDEHFANLRARVEESRRRPDRADAVLVPGGPFIAGGAGSVGPFQMDDTDNPVRAVELDPFYIDRTAVTNARYREFLEEAGSSSEFAHPDEPEDKDYTPAHWRDPRFNAPDHPVVGIDWYDAWAFARWAGGSLPSEEQWEKAARGTGARTYPWGDEWDPARANGVHRAYGVDEVRDLEHLEQILVSTTLDHPGDPVVAADALPEGAGPYGTLNMAGNVWEITRTNFFTGEDMSPFFRGRKSHEFMNRPEAFHVLKGGTWTSPPVCMTTYYRGRDLMTDRHNEVGFRCVYPVPGTESE